ncbi:hypothetical protein [Parerythrobacter aestuarii]|uniref:hypothetical protein n=1 Tax=Parerythrobacter aestuarii TaxID=3020909 RepID=UPI0024DE3D76|nr:hypothetical protein [Parerythrobacter aestuarii]
MPEHLGFDSWPYQDPNFPYPISDIDLETASERLLVGKVEIALPRKLAKPKLFAERGVGINEIGELTFGVRCTRKANGAIDVVGVFSIVHGHFFPAHGETDSGTRQTFLIPDANMRKGGFLEALLPHGPHCDIAQLSWMVVKGGVWVHLSLLHMDVTPKRLLEQREESKRRAKHKPKRDYPLPPFPLPRFEDKDYEKPKEEKKPTPVGAVPKSGIGEAVAGLLERAARWIRGA